METSNTEGKSMSKGRPVLVTTKHRGVFFGYLNGDHSKESLVLRGARNCIYWDKPCGGFLGLASKGPVGESRVGERCDELELYDITSIAKVTAEAVKLWESKLCS